jgi:hypothetical protein
MCLRYGLAAAAAEQHGDDGHLRGERAGGAEPMPWTEVGQGARPNSAGVFQPAHHRPGAGPEPEAAAVQAAVERAAREAREAGRREGETAARQASQTEVQRAVADFVSAVRQVSEAAHGRPTSFFLPRTKRRC